MKSHREERQRYKRTVHHRVGEKGGSRLRFDSLSTAPLRNSTIPLSLPTPHSAHTSQTPHTTHTPQKPPHDAQTSQIPHNPKRFLVPPPCPIRPVAQTVYAHNKQPTQQPEKEGRKKEVPQNARRMTGTVLSYFQQRQQQQQDVATTTATRCCRTIQCRTQCVRCTGENPRMLGIWSKWSVSCVNRKSNNSSGRSGVASCAVIAIIISAFIMISIIIGITLIEAESRTASGVSYRFTTSGKAVTLFPLPYVLLSTNLRKQPARTDAGGSD